MIAVKQVELSHSNWEEAEEVNSSSVSIQEHIHLAFSSFVSSSIHLCEFIIVLLRNTSNFQPGRHLCLFVVLFYLVFCCCLSRYEIFILFCFLQFILAIRKTPGRGVFAEIFKARQHCEVSTELCFCRLGLYNDWICIYKHA